MTRKVGGHKEEVADLVLQPRVAFGRRRRCEFDADFVELARSVARHNGERIQVKNAINRLAGSRFIEEKQYQA